MLRKSFRLLRSNLEEDVKLAKQGQRIKEENLFSKIRKNKIPYLFISPFFILFAIFMLYPTIYSFYLSFFKWSGAGPKAYVGLLNYTDLLTNRPFKQSLINAVILFFEYVPAMTLLALILASLLNSRYLRLQSVFRTFIFLPYVTAIIAVTYAFQLLLDKRFGMVNLFLSWFGVEPTAWLNTPNLARICLSGLVTWRWLGYNMVLLLAGLQNISPELYEAAKIDGATPTQSFFRITLPLMKPMLLFCILLSTIGTVSLFDEPFILFNAGGGPRDATLTPVLYLYNTGFRYLHFGSASSIAYALFIILFLVGLFEIKVMGEKK